MKRVFKYIIKPGVNEILLQRDSIVLSVAFQEDALCMWVLVNTSKCAVMRKFRAYGTGWEIEEKNITFIGTAHMADGLVFHLFEIDNDIDLKLCIDSNPQ